MPWELNYEASYEKKEYNLTKGLLDLEQKSKRPCWA